MSAVHAFPPPELSVQTAEKTTATGTLLRIYTPPILKPNQAIVLYIHGGGCVLGSVDEDDAIARRHAKDTGLMFVSVEYRLAPQHPYPAGLEDCIEAAQWCVLNAAAFGSRPKVLLMGVSAGGALALATALKLLKDGKESELQGVAACQPITLHPDAVPEAFKTCYTSYDEHSRHTINTRKSMKKFLG